MPSLALPANRADEKTQAPYGKSGEPAEKRRQTGMRPGKKPRKRLFLRLQYRSNSGFGTIPAWFHGPLAHAWLEQRTHNPLVLGSTPRGPTKRLSKAVR